MLKPREYMTNVVINSGLMLDLRHFMNMGSSCCFNRVIDPDLAGKITRFGMIHLWAGRVKLMTANQRSHIADCNGCHSPLIAARDQRNKQQPSDIRKLTLRYMTAFHRGECCNGAMAGHLPKILKLKPGLTHCSGY